MNIDSEDLVRAEELRSIYEEFREELQDLRDKQRAEFDELLSRLIEKKTGEIKNKIQAL